MREAVNPSIPPRPDAPHDDRSETEPIGDIGLRLSALGPLGRRYVCADPALVSAVGDRHGASPIARLLCSLQHRPDRAGLTRQPPTFFLDEATAFANGYRPCYQCNRLRFEQFQEAWTRAGLGSARPDSIDKLLEAQRGHREAAAGSIPDGGIVVVAGEPFLVRGGQLIRWTEHGYHPAETPVGQVEVVTPVAVLDLFRSGFSPAVHPSAGE